MKEKDFYSLKELIMVDKYPERPEQNRVFYRQSGALIQTLHHMLEPGDMSILVALIADKKWSLAKVLEKRLYWSDEKIETLKT